MTVTELLSSFIEAQTIESVGKFLSDIRTKVEEIGCSSECTPVDLLSFAEECIQQFVKLNWLSPVQRDTTEVSQTFGLDGCNLLPFSKSPQLLLIARGIFKCFPAEVHSNPKTAWAQMRATALYQWMLDEFSISLKAETEKLLARLQADDMFMSYLQTENLEMLFLLECFHVLRYHGNRKLANECLENATKLSNLEIGFASALGKRTRYQTESIAQLFLNVRKSGSGENLKEQAFDTVDPSLLPNNVTIDDDTFLNEVKFETDEKRSVDNLSPESQALVLAKCLSYAESLPKEDYLLKEEVAAFLQVVLKNPVDWAIQFHALYLRSKWEQEGSASSRKLDRALRQLDHLSSDDAFRFFQVNSKVDSKDSVREDFNRKFCYFFAALPPAPWTVQRCLGDLLNRLGSTASALEIYERLHSWSDVISAYTRLERREKAETLIRAQLDRARTPEMLVYLGDCTGEAAHYEEAWRISNEKCSKAQRNLGFLLAQNKEFAAAASCFKKCLAINPLQNAVWFAYGCVGFALNDFQIAADGFYKCTQLDSDNGEAWSNLATSYIKLGQKPRAVVILQEAIRCQYDNWRLWENYLLITVDCGVFNEAIRAMHRLIDLRGKFTDADVLEIVSGAVCSNVKDASGKPSKQHRSALLELFGRILSHSSPDAKISRYHADVILASEDVTPEDVYRAISSLQRAVRQHLQVPTSSWTSDEFKVVKDVLNDAVQLHNVFLKYAVMPNATEIDTLKTSLKYMLSNVASRATAAVRDVDDSNSIAAVSERLDDLSNILKTY